jgi:hypothetical protein
MELIAFIFIVFLLAGAALILWGIIAFVRAVLAPSSTGQQRLITRDQGDTIDGMNDTRRERRIPKRNTAVASIRMPTGIGTTVSQQLMAWQEAS